MIETMKKIAILLASLAILSACGGGNSGGGENNKPETPPSITIPSTVNRNPVLGTEGGSAEVTFTASGAWTAGVINTRAADWISVAPTSGSAGSGKITITAKPNDTPDERGATIQIKCGSATQNIVLTQKQKDSFTATASKTELGKEGGSFTIEVKANVSFTYSIDKGEEWLKYQGTKALTTSTISFTASANEDVERREGRITVKSDAGQEVFTIYQDGGDASIILSEHNVPIGDTGGSFTVDVRHNVDVTVKVQDGVTWLRENSTKAMSTNTFHFTVDANEGTDSREADVFFTNTANGLSETLHVIQAQKDAIVIAQSTYEIPSDGGKFTVRISHNVDFTTDISADWITNATTKAMVTEDIVFNVAANDSGEDRTGTVTFKAGNLQQVVTVKQLYTAPDPSTTKPGVFGVKGLNWEYRDQQDQMLIRDKENSFYFALIEPETNKIFAVSFDINEDPKVGLSVNATILQNISSDEAGLIDSITLVVTKVEDAFVWLRPSTASSEYIIVKYK